MTRENEIYKVTLVGGVANLLLVGFKLVAGIVGHSGAMLADAVHSVSDFVTDVVYGWRVADFSNVVDADSLVS